MNVLVTGAAGRTGSVVVRHLVEQGFTVRATDCVYRSDLPVKIEVANLLDPMACYPLLEGVEGIVHLANYPNQNLAEAKLLYNENVSMNMNIFGIAAEMGGKRIVFSSTVQTMSGRRSDEVDPLPPSQLKYLPLDGNTPANPGNTYALSKVASEQMLALFAQQGKLTAVALRFPFLAAPEWAWRARRSTRYHSNPDEAFSYLYTTDAAALIAAILRTDLPGFRIYFPAATTTTSTREIPDLIAQYYPDVPLRKPAASLSSLVDISVIEAETGWRPLETMPIAQEPQVATI